MEVSLQPNNPTDILEIFTNKYFKPYQSVVWRLLCNSSTVQTLDMHELKGIQSLTTEKCLTSDKPRNKKVKVKLSLERAMKTQRGSRGIALLFL